MNLDFIAYPLGAVFRFLYNLVSGLDTNLFSAYAMAIILSTILVKMLLLPLTFKQTKSMKAMQDMAPRLKELQDKYGKDPQTLQRKQMELYKEANYNPFSGCLPLLIQFPIIIAFFYVLRDPVFAFSDFGASFSLAELASKIGLDLSVLNETLKNSGESTIKTLQGLINYATTANIDYSQIADAIVISGDKFWIWTNNFNRSFLWIKDLSFASNVVLSNGTLNGLNMGISLPIIGSALPILAAISGYTTYLTSKMTNSAQMATMNEQQKSTQSTMNIMMPIIIFVTALNFPSGLALYWVVSNVFQLVQQWVIMNSSKRVKEE